MLLRTLLLIALAGLPTLAHAQGPPPPPPPPIPPLLPPPIPAGNPVTAAKTNLGKVLFWDEQLSTSNPTACGTCHIFARGGSDPRTTATNPAARHPGVDAVFGTGDDVLGSPGVSRQDAGGAYLGDASFGLRAQVTGRKSPSVINAAYASTLFWDGRADASFEDPVTGAPILAAGAALESQASGPPMSSVEMGHVGTDWATLTAKIAAAKPLRLSPQIGAQLTNYIAGRTYPQLFQEAFGTPDVTAARISMAIATYERALFSNQTPIDQQTALTPQEQQGAQIFGTIGRCAGCHAGTRFTNDSFQYIGVRPQNDDLGRFAVTANAADRGRMKVPSLRNVELRAPYFHNGEMPSLEAVVDFYDRGGDFNAPNKNPLIAPIGLSPAQKAALVAFLKRPMTDPRIAAGTAPFDRPLLYSESNNIPAHLGTGTPGSGGFVPRMIADEPPAVGNGSFTLAVDTATGGSPVRLLLSNAVDMAGVPFRGANLYVHMGTGTRILPVGSLSGTGAGGGFASITLPIPADASLLGTTMYGQWVVLEPTLGGRIAASEAVALTYF